MMRRQLAAALRQLPSPREALYAGECLASVLFARLTRSTRR